MPPTKTKKGLAEKLGGKKLDPGPLWRGPSAEGPNGGVTQSMLSAFLVCRERFRLKYVLGWRVSEGFSKTLEYGQFWHACEEAHAKGIEWRTALDAYAETLLAKYPMQRQEVEKWWSVCAVQFPIYAEYWSKHQDVVERTPLMQEQVFDVPYRLPSGRTVRLRGKWDGGDIVGKGKAAGIFIQENKTKGDVDEEQLRRQLTFDLQNGVYLAALNQDTGIEKIEDAKKKYPIKGVRYNVIRRPLSGGKGSIKQKEATKNHPAETASEYYLRLQQYFIEEPEYWFMRWNAEISPQEVKAFETRCLIPLLEQLCDWYAHISIAKDPFLETRRSEASGRGVHWQHPFGVYNSMNEGRESDFDAYLQTGNSAGLVRREKLFEELQ